MQRKTPFVLVVVVVGFSVTAALSQESRPPQETEFQRAAALYEQNLLRLAERNGIWPSDRYPLNRTLNPYYLRGDFNNDGQNDVAFWVYERASGLSGLAIVHSTMDSLYLFGAGKPAPTGDLNYIEIGQWLGWFVRRIGSIEDHPWNSVPEIGVEQGKPFRFDHESIEIVYIAKSAYALYWSGGRYHVIWTAD